MMGQWILAGVALLVLVFEGVYIYLKKREQIRQARPQEDYSFDELLEEVKEDLYQATKEYTQYSLGSEDYIRSKSRALHLRKALRQCSYGSKDDKNYVIEEIRHIIKKKDLSQQNLVELVPYHASYLLSGQDCFELLLFYLETSYQDQALDWLIDKYELDQVKQVIENQETLSYIITEEEVKKAYDQEAPQFSKADLTLFIAGRIYQEYKGFGVIERIRDMSIDGVSGGVSGRIDDNDENAFRKRLKEQENHQKEGRDPRHYDSVWIFYKGKSIHLSFLSFGSEKELRRVCQNIYRFNKAGQLSENIGYKVNEMYDGSRVVVVRPPFSETWAFFVRKFHIKTLTFEELYQGANAGLLYHWMTFLVKGARITAITGAQGTGKTTLLMAMVKHIYGTLTLRIQELAFELHLRKVYPMRNILSFKETAFISGQEGLDLQKKTDGAVNILGEVATDEVSALMLQVAQVASLFTLFTHHAKTSQDLILALRNSLLKCDVFRDEAIAKDQVCQVLHFDIHLNKDHEGNRYVERITEIGKDGLASNIIHYEEGAYVLDRLPAKEQLDQMAREMTPQDQDQFNHFIAACRKELGQDAPHESMVI